MSTAGELQGPWELPWDPMGFQGFCGPWSKFGVPGRPGKSQQEGQEDQGSSKHLGEGTPRSLYE